MGPSLSFLSFHHLRLLLFLNPFTFRISRNTFIIFPFYHFPDKCNETSINLHERYNRSIYKKKFSPSRFCYRSMRSYRSVRWVLTISLALLQESILVGVFSSSDLSESIHLSIDHTPLYILNASLWKSLCTIYTVHSTVYMMYLDTMYTGLYKT